MFGNTNTCMVDCDVCGTQYDREPPKRIAAYPLVCDQSCLLEYMANRDIHSKVSLLDDSQWRQYEVVTCEWCKQPFPKRASRIGDGRSKFCSRWCQGRQKADSDAEPHTLKHDDDRWPHIRQQAWERDNAQCQLCGQPQGVLERRPEVALIDDSVEDPFAVDNAVCVCRDCLQGADAGDLQRARRTPTTPHADKFLCPHDDCAMQDVGSWFDSKRSMHIHYGAAHDGSLAREEKPCQNCEATFEYYPSRSATQIHCDECLEALNDYNEAVCPQCGDEFLALGLHWSNSKECDFPEISDRQHEIITGLLMGDGSMQLSHSEDRENPRLIWSMITEPFMKWLDSELSPLTLGNYHLRRTSEEAAELAVRSGLTNAADPENYSAMYRNLSRAHPDLEEYEQWYESGEKRFPIDELDLTPLTMKVWYVCDGSLSRRNPKPTVRIACLNESDRIDKLAAAVSQVVGASVKSSADNEKLQFNTEESRAFFDYIGWDPLPGFDYKWPDKSEYQ